MAARDGVRAAIQPPPFAVAPQDFMALVNRLALLRFFELPAQLPARASYFVKPDGSVGRQWLKMADATSYRLCFWLPAYERCVEFRDGDAPPELQALVQRLLADAELHKLSQAH